MSDAQSPLTHLLAPRSVAVIGASEDQTKFGGRLYKTLLRHGYAGTVYPINPGRESLFGIKTFPSISAVPEPPDMVVMALPREKVLAEITAAAARGAKGGIIITAKFSDAGAEGAVLEREIVAAARAKGMRLIGPNCLGVISPANKVVLCSSPAMDVDYLPISPIGFVSQSGALMATLFDRAWDQGIGFTHCVSVGNQADLELCDFVEYMIDDPRTKVICSYIEGLKDPQRFVALARRVRAAGKIWLACKAGRTDAGVRAAFSHTASIAGSYPVLAAVCREEGISLLDDPVAMISLAGLIALHPSATIRTVAIATTSGGGGALAADALAARKIALAQFTPDTRQALDGLYSPGQALNPVDFGGRKFDDAADVSRATASILCDDDNTDAILLAITTAPMLSNLVSELSAGLRDAQGQLRKPAIIVMQPGKAADAARSVLRSVGLPFVNSESVAFDLLQAWIARGQSQPGNAQLPDLVKCDVANTRAAIATNTTIAALRTGEYDEAATKALLNRYGVPVNHALIARTAEQAIISAEQLGYPVVLKIVSTDIVHKSDAGGVELALVDRDSVAAAYGRMTASAKTQRPDARIEGVSVQTMFHGSIELIVGARSDTQFGPVVVIGAGGIWVELLPQTVIARAPVSTAYIETLLRRLPIWPILVGYRGRPINLPAVLDAIERIGWFASDLAGRDFELDVNPLIVSADSCCAVDARLRIG